MKEIGFHTFAIKAPLVCFHTHLYAALSTPRLKHRLNILHFVLRMCYQLYCLLLSFMTKLLSNVEHQLGSYNLIKHMIILTKIP